MFTDFLLDMFELKGTELPQFPQNLRFSALSLMASRQTFSGPRTVTHSPAHSLCVCRQHVEGV